MKAARSRATVDVPFSATELEPDAENALTIELSLAGGTRWAERGHTVATGQFVPPHGDDAPSPLRATPELSAPLTDETTDRGIVISRPSFELVFDETFSVVDSFSYRDRELFDEGPVVGFW